MNHPETKRFRSSVWLLVVVLPVVTAVIVLSWVWFGAVGFIGAVAILAMTVCFRQVNAIDPIAIRVGMSWQEATLRIERVACFKNFSSLQMYTSGPATTGSAEYECKYGYKFYQFLDDQCLCVVLRAPFRPDKRVQHVAPTIPNDGPFLALAQVSSTK